MEGGIYRPVTLEEAAVLEAFQVAVAQSCMIQGLWCQHWCHNWYQQLQLPSLIKKRIAWEAKRSDRPLVQYLRIIESLLLLCLLFNPTTKSASILFKPPLPAQKGYQKP